MEEAGKNWDRRGDMEWENNVIVFQLKKKISCLLMLQVLTIMNCLFLFICFTSVFNPEFIAII